MWPHCGIKSKNNGDMGLMIEYSILWNITGFPSGILPITDVLSSEQTFTDDHKDFWTDVINDDAEGSEGMPICLQVVGYAYEDEKVLGIMKVLKDKIGYKMAMPPPMKGL
jgi:Asp-tRNA(Asn)/Glu-tRNA(Gln) amidotransferase A subunit family amidase